MEDWKAKQAARESVGSTQGGESAPDRMRQGRLLDRGIQEHQDRAQAGVPEDGLLREDAPLQWGRRDRCPVDGRADR